MFFMILLGIIAGVFIHLIIHGLPTLAYTGIRLLILPLVIGVGFEYIMLAGKHDNFLTRILSAPGLWVQRITTKEPTADMVEVAIVSTKCALRDEYPEFMEFFEAKSWEGVKSDEATDKTDASDEAPAAEDEETVDDSVAESLSPVENSSESAEAADTEKPGESAADPTVEESVR